MSTSLASSSSVSRPPVADGLPLIGSLIPMLGDPAKFMTAQYLKHGPVFQVKVLNNAFTVLAGPEAVEYMTTEDDTLTGEPMWKQFVTQFGGQNNITAMDGPDHARLRKVMRRGFSRTAALETSAVTIAATRRLLHRWAPGTPIPAAEFIVEVIAEVLGSITLGRASGEYLPDFLIMWRNYLWAKVIGIKSKDVLESAEYKRALARV
jgi:cytochrome P450